MSAPTVQWIKQNATFDTASGDNNPSIALFKGVSAATDRVYVAYTTAGTVSGGTRVITGTANNDIAVMKMNALTGDVEWVRQLLAFNTVLGENTPRIAVDSSGNAYVAYETVGTTSGNSKISSGSDLAICKLDTNGVVKWVRQNNIFNSATGLTVPGLNIEVRTTNIYVVSTTLSSVSGNSFSPNNIVVVMAMDFNGNVVWIKQQSDFNTSSGNSFAPSICVDSSDNIYVQYFAQGTASGSDNTHLGTAARYDLVIFKMNSSGTVQWIRQNASFNTTLDEIDYPTTILPNYTTNGVVTDIDGDVYGTYTTQGTTSGQTFLGQSDIVVAKFDKNNGDLLWIRQNASFNTTNFDYLASITHDSTSNTIIVAFVTLGAVSGLTNTGGEDLVVFSLDAEGTFIWALQNSSFNTTVQDFSPEIVAHRANAYIAFQTAGTTSGNTNVGSNDIAVFKLAPLVCLAGDTLITMHDGSLKMIKDIERGDITSTGEKVAKLRKEPHHRSSQVDLITFEPGCLGNGLPHRKIIVTPAHPFFYKGARRPASWFTRLEGVTLHKKCIIGEFFNTTDTTVYLYDLQFDHDGSYIANGVEVQSRSPRSSQTPLEKELYFDSALFDDTYIMNDFQTTHQIPLIAN